MKYFTLLAATASAAIVEDIPAWVNRCRSQPDGTQLPDPSNPQGYVECQDNQPVQVDCPDSLYWDQYFLECQPKKACRAPQNWNNLSSYSYVDGIYYHTWVQTGDYGIIQARWLCPLLGGKDAMPYTQAEYENMMAEQNKAISDYLATDECNDPENPTRCEPNNPEVGDYMFYIGIEQFLREYLDEFNTNDANPFTYADYYYYDTSRTTSKVDWYNYGLPFTMTQWWLPGYPTNQTPSKKENWDHFMDKHVAQVGNQGLMNVDGGWRLDGANCMYVCPGY